MDCRELQTGPFVLTVLDRAERATENLATTNPTSSLDQDSITFGKYNGKTLTHVLKDRGYCKWLLDQDWFRTNYEYLYNRVKEYNPRVYFLPKVVEKGGEEEGDTDFIQSYPYFNLTPLSSLALPSSLALSNNERVCYSYYLSLIESLKNRIIERISKHEENPYDIKAPIRWLKRFERESGLSRDDFKTFLASYELPNIPYIVERIKKEGGLDYKGARSYKIAKERSLRQEEWWEKILKGKYGEEIGTQYKYRDCIFDFIHIPSSTIYECKLGLKDYDKKQHRKYLLALEEYRIVYLIGRDCLIDMRDRRILVEDVDKYILLQCDLYLKEEDRMNELEKCVIDFRIEEVESIGDVV